MRILFVCQNDFAAPTEKQVVGFAQQLVARGHEVAISLGGDIATAQQEGVEEVPGLTLHQHHLVGRRVSEGDLCAARAFAPTLIHALNSRTAVVAATEGIAEATNAPVFVHFEDDEWRAHAGLPNDSPYHRLGRHARRAGSRFRPAAWDQSTRASLNWVRRRARALDALTPALASEVAHQLERDCAVVPPVMPRLRPKRSPGTAFNLPVDIGDVPIALFTGTVWPVYLEDVLLGMRAVAEVRSRGVPLVFAHAGRVHPRLDLSALARSAGLGSDATVFLGYLPFHAVPPLLERASVLLQPGPPSRFNRLRLPSKLQAYLESGTPTVTFAVGTGELLADRREVLKTYTDAPVELADRLVELITDRGLRLTLSRHGPIAANRLFDPHRNTDALLNYYRAGLEAAPEVRR